jgi:hypothetical protein
LSSSDRFQFGCKLSAMPVKLNTRFYISGNATNFYF